ncbi:MAG: hypothetical protein ACE5FF_04765 [Saprospiraceae bacterium]
MKKENLKSLVADGQTGKVLEALLQYSKTKGFRHLGKAVQLLQARHAKYESDESLGLLDYRDAQLTRNQINAAVLELLDGDLEKDLPAAPAANGKKKGKLFLILAAVAVAVFLFAKFALPGSPRAFSLTVFVHGPEGPQQRILKNEGKVALHIGQDLREASINEKGEAGFKEIPPEFAEQKALIEIVHDQPYQSTHPDSLYELRPDVAIYLEVALQGTGKIFGTVFDFDSGDPLDSVRISVRNAATYTDSHGWFELEIPAALQAKFQKVSFEKAEYGFQQMDSIPVHTQQEIEVALMKKNK